LGATKVNRVGDILDRQGIGATAPAAAESMAFLLLPGRSR